MHLWPAIVNKALNRESSDGKFPDEHVDAIIGDSLASIYLTRPKSSLPSSLSVDKLRGVLRRAPRRPYADLDGMEIDDYIFKDGDNRYEWDTEYINELFTAFLGVVDEHGLRRLEEC